MTSTTRIARATRGDVARRRRTIAGLQASSRSGRLSSPTDWTFLTGGPYPDGPVPATEHEAMSLPPFGRGVALLANAVAGTDWRAMRWDAEAGVALRIADQPAVLLDPDPSSTPWNYRWSATEDLILYGNHFALYGDLDYRTLRPGWLVPLPADDVWLIVDPGNGDYAFTVAGELVGADSLLHVSAGNRSGEVLGRGVLGQYAEWLGGALAAETHAGAYFAGAALPPAVLQSPTVLTQAQATELKSKWRTMTSDREPVVLPSGYVLTPIVSNAEQAQLVESRTWNAQAVAMMLGIPSYKLGLPGASMTYQNIESADIEFVRDSVDRYAGPLSQAFTKWLMPRGTSVAWDYSGRMRADAAQTSTVLATLVASGVLTVDEARAMIGRAPLDQSVEETETPSGVPDLTPSEVPQ
jgi:HK97 family phage portal protein